MAQTRNFKIGTVYSRLRSLLEKKAMNEEAKPVWYDIYEAFPPKYEPRFDRHLLSYGAGSNVAKSAPPPKILYKEDKIRAQYYTAFMPNNGKQHGSIRLVGQLPNMGIPTAYVGACTSDPNPHPELI